MKVFTKIGEIKETNGWTYQWNWTMGEGGLAAENWLWRKITFKNKGGGREEWGWRKTEFTIKRLALKEVIGGCTSREKKMKIKIYSDSQSNDKVKKVIQVVMFAEIIIFRIIYLKT